MDIIVQFGSNHPFPRSKSYSTQHTTMSDSPRSGPSQRSHAVGFRERLPLLSEESLSPQYTSVSPTPPRPSNTETYHGTTTIALAEDPADLGTINETPKSSFESADQQQHHYQERNFTQTRPGVSLYHKYNPQLVLENRGSTARDHLASERTFLAYVRTSLALASAGVALVQLFTSSSVRTPGGETNKTVKNFAQPVGVSMVAMALITLGIGMCPVNLLVTRISVFFLMIACSGLQIFYYSSCSP